MTLNKLTPDDWRALSAVCGPCPRYITSTNTAYLSRLDVAGIAFSIGSGKAEITNYGSGVIAAARVLVHGTSSVAAAWAEADRANAEVHRLLAQTEEAETDVCPVSGEFTSACLCFGCDPPDDMPPGYGED